MACEIICTDHTESCLFIFGKRGFGEKDIGTGTKSWWSEAIIFFGELSSEDKRSDFDIKKTSLLERNTWNSFNLMTLHFSPWQSGGYRWPRSTNPRPLWKTCCAWTCPKRGSFSNLRSIRRTLIETQQKIWPREDCHVINWSVDRLVGF